MIKDVKFIDYLLKNMTEKKQKITQHTSIALSQTKLETNEWQKVDNISCVFVDLDNSTQVATGNIRQAMQIFSNYGGSLVKIFDFYRACYIDIQGDGGFALFDGTNAVNNALSTSVTTNSLFNNILNLGVRIGIDIGAIYVKKVGIRGENKEIWLGSPVNIASKLCNLKIPNIDTIRISNTFFKTIPQAFKKHFILYQLNQHNISSFCSANLDWNDI